MQPEPATESCGGVLGELRVIRPRLVVTGAVKASHQTVLKISDNGVNGFDEQDQQQVERGFLHDSSLVGRELKCPHIVLVPICKPEVDSGRFQDNDFERQASCDAPPRCFQRRFFRYVPATLLWRLTAQSVGDPI